MNIVPLVFQILALVSMVFAAFNLFQSQKVNYGWLGLAFWFVSFMVESVGLHQAGSPH